MNNFQKNLSNPVIGLNLFGYFAPWRADFSSKLQKSTNKTTQNILEKYQNGMGIKKRKIFIKITKLPI
jgi:hypothetical protein